MIVMHSTRKEIFLKTEKMMQITIKPKKKEKEIKNKTLKFLKIKLLKRKKN
jgi:hypothetical protein